MREKVVGVKYVKKCVCVSVPVYDRECVFR